MATESGTVPLRQYCLRITKGTTPTTLGRAFVSDGINFIKSEAITADGRIDPSTFAFIDDDTHQKLSRSILQESDVLFSMAGVYLGKTAVVPRSVLPANTNQAVGIIRVDQSKADPRFIHYALSSPSVRSLVDRSVSQSAQPNFNLNDIGELPIPSLPLHDQRAIAYILGTLDDKIELNRRMNETLEAMARAIFKSWFVDFDPVHARAEGRQPFGMDSATGALFPSSFEDSTVGKIPKGWNVGPVLGLAELLSGGTPKTSHEEFWNGDILWTSAKDVSQCRDTFLLQTERNITDSGLAESATQLIPRFCTVVVARGATTGRMALLGREMAMNQTCYALASKTNTPFSLYCMLRNEIENLVHAGHGSVFDTITTSTFESSQVILPSQPVLKAFEAQIAPLFQRLLANTLQTSNLAAIRDVLLPKLISGELRVRPTDRLLLEVPKCHLPL